VRSLTSWFTKSKNRLSPRIERWQQKLQGYTFRIEYKEGHKNIADFISRINNQEQPRESEKAKQYVNHVIKIAIPYSMSIEQIQRETLLDPECRVISQSIT
jgi:hypothetical protein